jgi:argininosuccinate lyase
LGFSRVSQNSLDAVGDRDFVCEFLFCLAMIGMHLSRLSEDLITWSTHEFGFVEFSDAFSTGSSLMPQKKNPDLAELTRGKTGRLYGNLLSILTTLKALRSSYNRDMQEDKEALFDSVDTIKTALDVFAAMLPELKINRDRMETAASDPNLLATDLAEYLVKKGTPFREAHEIIGKLVAECATRRCLLNQVPLGEMRKLSPLFDVDVANVFDVRRSLSERRAIGAPSPENIAAQIKRWRSDSKQGRLTHSTHSAALPPSSNFGVASRAGSQSPLRFRRRQLAGRVWPGGHAGWEPCKSPSGEGRKQPLLPFTQLY